MSEAALTKEELFGQIMKARTRVYQLASATPLEVYAMPGGWEMLLKREDLSPIHSYKWRGAFNFMKAREKEARLSGVAAASAGNHAQGVALAASRLGISAHLFMPKAAPRLKVEAAAKLGGSWADIRQVGDNFDQAAAAADDFCRQSGALYVPPYDDMLVMAGQGVLGDELMIGPHRPDVVFLQIGGGGLAAGAATAIKTYDPSVRIVGVEEEGQASMAAAFAAGEPVTLDHVDVFCDGTAVKRAGRLPFELLRELLDDLVLVTVGEVSAAIQKFWQVARVLPEPSGAMGLAAARKCAEKLRGLKAGVVLTGANLDFRQLAQIARRSGGADAESKPHYQIRLEERPGTMLALMKTVAPLGLNISYLMCGQNDRVTAFPIVGFDAPRRKAAELERLLTAGGYEFKDVSGRADLSFRIAPFQPALFKRPFAAILNFPERPGALAEFLDRLSPLGAISYFNYVHTGEQVGRALVVLSFESDDNRRRFLADLEKKGPHYTHLAPETFEALGVGHWAQSGSPP
ncbi:MAG: pyridoxal-phosphate dependent enzyme [Candidatus Adiutrix sp.]|jgi:threonine dehydratase|nr:pyridoxal-phosphate dependent enzyme [Candidatus Adiutrix sp.]